MSIDTYNQQGRQLTLAKIADTLAVHRCTIIVNVSHQELPEVANDSPPDALIRNPLHDRLCLDVTKLLKWYLLWERS